MKNLKVVLTVVLMCIALKLNAEIAVGTCRPDLTSYSTIQSAVNAAASGETVDVCPGTYLEAVVIGKPLTLRGIQSGNADRAVIQGATTSASIAIPLGRYGSSIAPVQSPNTIFPQVLVQNTGPVTINNLTVDGSTLSDFDTVGIYYQNSSGTVSNVVTRQQYSAGIWLENDSGSLLSVSVFNSVVRYSTGKAIGIVASSSTLSLSVDIESNSVLVGLVPIYAYQTNGTIAKNLIEDQEEGGMRGIILDVGSTINAAQNTLNGNTSTAGVVVASSGNTVSKNTIFGVTTGILIDVGANSNTVNKNTINFGKNNVGSAVDFACNVVIGNTVQQNTINDFSYGVANVPVGNTVGSNSFFNVDNVMTSCP